MLPSCFSVLTLRREAQSQLPVHRAHRIPVHADVAADRVRVAPGSLNGICEVESLPAGRSVERFARLDRERYCEGLSSAAGDAIVDRDGLVRAHRSRTIAQI